MTILRSGSATDVGRVRAINEDQALDSPTLFAVADGMGGHVGGDVAARTAVEALAHRFNIQPSPNGLVQAVRDANTAVWEKASADPDLRGMGTTMTAIGLVNTGEGDHLVLANVGDSRAYRYRAGALEQLTQDHSVAEELVVRGELTPSQAEIHPHRHILTRALGVGPDVEVDVWEVVPRQGDRLLLCSDGLSNELSADDIVEVLDAGSDPQQAADDLVRQANVAGGNDNITVVVVDVLVGEGDGDEDTGSQPAVAAAASGEGDAAPPAAAGDEGGAGASGALGAAAAVVVATAGAVAASGAASAAPATGASTGTAPGTGAPGVPAGNGPSRPGVVTLSTTTFPTTGAPSGIGTPPPPGAGEPAKKKGRRRDRGPRKPRRITFRVLFFLVLLGAIAYGTWYLVRWYSNSSYYVGLVTNPSLQPCPATYPGPKTDCQREVVIYRGRPGGVLGMQPKIVAGGHTGVTLNQVPAAALLVQPNVRSYVQESSLADSLSYVHLLKCQANVVAPANAPTFPGLTDCPITATPTPSSTTVPGGPTVPGHATTTVPGATSTTAHALGRVRTAVAVAGARAA
ncbi:MAG TPA: Stp1/IreP family PP2C-type Ser/Thr phosphatase [Acidimicrobiales bacterium]|nr:Stp1/IreP family PP2C-type Ser/Thr phosphatase [Acidimicrobiales bacterium]